MNKTLEFLGLLCIFIFGVNGCGIPCSEDSNCGDNLCCSACCPDGPDCAINQKPNICGKCATVCPLDVKRCPDGSFVSKEGPDCEFAPCVGDICDDCNKYLKCYCGTCEDGINQFGCCGICKYERKFDGGELVCSGIISCPKCVPSLGPCPLIMAPVCCDGKQYSNQCFADNACARNCVRGVCPVVCPMDAKICPDGSFVGRVGPDCEFEECPSKDCGDDECMGGMGHCVKGSIVNCFVSPCRFNNGGCKKNQQCIENYCNGCNAICKNKNKNTDTM